MRYTPATPHRRGASPLTETHPLRFVHQKSVIPPNKRDKIDAARAYLRQWARPFVCWRIAGYAGGQPVLRFGGSDLDIPAESRTDEIADACRLYWMGEESK